jgi:TRAP-type C4-dicarboxylate transport system permease large subunit
MRSKENQQLVGWCLFILSAIFYIASSTKAKDMLGFLGGLFFLFACIVFVKDHLTHK